MVFSTCIGRGEHTQPKVGQETQGKKVKYSSWQLLETDLLKDHSVHHLIQKKKKPKKKKPQENSRKKISRRKYLKYIDL